MLETYWDVSAHEKRLCLKRRVNRCETIVWKYLWINQLISLGDVYCANCDKSKEEANFYHRMEMFRFNSHESVVFSAIIMWIHILGCIHISVKIYILSLGSITIVMIISFSFHCSKSISADYLEKKMFLFAVLAPRSSWTNSHFKVLFNFKSHTVDITMMLNIIPKLCTKEHFLVYLYHHRR